MTAIRRAQKVHAIIVRALPSSDNVHSNGDISMLRVWTFVVDFACVNLQDNSPNQLSPPDCQDDRLLLLYELDGYEAICNSQISPLWTTAETLVQLSVGVSCQQDTMLL